MVVAHSVVLEVHCRQILAFVCQGLMQHRGILVGSALLVTGVVGAGVADQHQKAQGTVAPVAVDGAQMSLTLEVTPMILCFRQRRLVCMLEGGYDLTGIANGTVAVLETLLG